MEKRILDRFLRVFTGFRYYKLALFALMLVFAYDFFTRVGGAFVHGLVGDTLYAAAFLGGALYAFGFTAPIGAGLFLSFSQQSNVFFLAIVGGLGAFTADYLILKTIRLSFQDEFNRLKKVPVMVELSRRFSEHLSERLKQYLLLGMAGFFIASPLPDEIGISLLAGFTRINERTFAVVSFILNTMGILILLLL